MSEAHYTELALLKCIASTLVFMVGKDNLLFITPYLIEYDNGIPSNLRMPDLDFPFHLFLEDGDKSHNKDLWNRYNKEGRDKYNHETVTIWQHILSVYNNKDISEFIEIVEDTISGNDFEKLKKDSLEFHPNIPDKLDRLFIIIAQVRQSCGSLIATITLVFSDEVNRNNNSEKIRDYLNFLRNGNYLIIRHDLHIAKMTVNDWRSWRMIEGSNHWGDAQSNFENFLNQTDEKVNLIRLDYGTNFNDANKEKYRDGKPSLKNLVTIDRNTSLIEDVIVNRVESLILSSYNIFSYKIEVLFDNEKSKKHNYLWFNAIALADVFFHAIRSYYDLPDSSSDRLWVSSSYKHNKFVFCKLIISVESSDITANVIIHESGLIGKEVKVCNCGSHLKAIYNSALISGAKCVLIRWLNSDTKTFKTYCYTCKKYIENDNNHENILDKIVEQTGVIFQIKGNINKNIALVKEQL